MPNKYEEYYELDFSIHRQILKKCRKLFKQSIKRQSFLLRRFGVVYYVFAKAISFFFGRFAPGTERIYSAAALA